jgi:hypothetical protein
MFNLVSLIFKNSDGQCLKESESITLPIRVVIGRFFFRIIGNVIKEKLPKINYNHS